MDLVTSALAQVSPDPTGGLLSYGVLGIVVVALFTEVLVPGASAKRERQENERLRALIDDKVYPAMEAGTAAVREAAEVMKELARILPVVEEWQREQIRRDRP